MNESKNILEFTYYNEEDIEIDEEIIFFQIFESRNQESISEVRFSINRNEKISNFKVNLKTLQGTLKDLEKDSIGNLRTVSKLVDFLK